MEIEEENDREENVQTCTKVATYVFLDFESTGLLDQRARITELCLLAVSRVDMLEPGVYPRVVNKLTLCLDPCKPISSSASYITGLYNDSLEHQKPLSIGTVALVTSFLDHLAHPVCLLAHNGNQFDFPLLMAELKRIKQSLDRTVLCADTLESFRSLDGLPLRYTPLSSHVTPSKRNNVLPNHDTGNSGVFQESEHAAEHRCKTSIKPQNVAVPPDLKRKSTEQFHELNFTSVKVPKSEIRKFDIDLPFGATRNNIEAEKVKKRLSFEEDRKDESMKDASSTESATLEKQTEEVTEADESELSFSESLDNSVYLTALETIEQDLANAGENAEKCDGNVCVDKSMTQQSSVSILTSDAANMSKRELEECNETTMQQTSNQMCVKANTAQSIVDQSHSSSNQDTCNVSYVEQATGYIVGKSHLSINIDRDDIKTADDSSTALATKASGTSSTTETKGVTVCTLSDTHKNVSNNSEDNENTQLVAGDNVYTSSSHHSLQQCTPTKSVINSGASTSSVSPSSSNWSSPLQQKSYKLEEIHLRIFGVKPPQGHRAEDDCVTLAKVTKCTTGFMEWIDQHAVLLSTIHPAY